MPPNVGTTGTAYPIEAGVLKSTNNTMRKKLSFDFIAEHEKPTKLLVKLGSSSPSAVGASNFRIIAQRIGSVHTIVD